MRLDNRPSQWIGVALLLGWTLLLAEVLPRVQARPALVVASALNPWTASRRALPMSQGFGITKQPASWSARNVSKRSVVSTIRRR